MIRALPVFCLAMLAPALALAEEPYPELPATPPQKVAAPARLPPITVRKKEKEDEPSLVNLIRIDAMLGYFRGSKLVGHGTRAFYQGASGSLYLDGAYFPWRYVGFDFRMRGTAISTSSVQSEFELDGAFAVAPLQWKGDVSGSLTLGAGGGIEIAGQRHDWMNEEARGFPIAFARLRLLPARRVMVEAQYRVVPVTTGRLLQAPFEEHFHRLELGAAVKYFHFGARAEISDVTGGVPARTYRENAVGVFAGAGWY